MHAAFVCAGLVAGAQAQVTYHVTPLPGTGEATSINDSGQVTGSITLPSGAATTAFVLSGSSLTFIPPFNSGMSATSYATQINASGNTAGYASAAGAAYPNQRGFSDINGTINEVPLFGGPDNQNLETRAFGINAGNTVVGFAQISGDSTGILQHAFVATQSSGGTLNVTDLNSALAIGGSSSAAFGINDAGTIVGWSENSASDIIAVKYNGTTLTNFGTLGGSESAATAINNAGTVVGWSDVSGTNDLAAFVATGSTMTALGPVTDYHGYTLDNSEAYGINNAGVIVGQAWTLPGSANPVTGDSRPDGIGFVYNGSGSPVDLNTLIDAGTPYVIRSANSINNNGQIAGFASESGYEPATNQYGGAQRGVILTPETHFNGSVDSTWDSAGNWAQGAPAVFTAANVTSATSLTLTGPAAPTTVFALTLDQTNPANPVSLVLQSGGVLTITADVALEGASIDATQQALNVSIIEGYGSLSGTFNVGDLNVLANQTMNINGTINAAWYISMESNAVLNAQGTLTTGSVQGLGTINLTNNLTIGSNTSSGIYYGGNVNVGSNTLTLLNKGPAQIGGGTMAGGTINASNGLAISGLTFDGYGNITGPVVLTGGVIAATSGQQLNVNGSISGYGMVIGNVASSGFANSPTGTLLRTVNSPVLNLGNRSATVYSIDVAELGTFQMSGGTVTAPHGVQLLTTQYGSDSLTGFGTITGTFYSAASTTITGTGDLTLGANVSSGFVSNGSITQNAGTLTLISQNQAQVHTVTLAGGNLNAANGVFANGYVNYYGYDPTVSGYGTINSALTFSPGYYGELYATGGTLTVGDGSSHAFNMTYGTTIIASGATLNILSSVPVSPGEFASIQGGTLTENNGVSLVSNTELTGNGIVNGNVTLTNAVIGADSGTTLIVNGSGSGYGITYGNVVFTGGFTTTPGILNFAYGVNIGSNNATVISSGPATVESFGMAGGTITAPLGLTVIGGISGYGTVNPGSTGVLNVQGGTLQAPVGQTLAINGSIAGYGITIGNITVPAGDTFFASPSGTVLISYLSIGTQTANVWSSGTCQVYNGYAGNSYTNTPNYQSSVTVEGGSFNSPTGLAVQPNGAIGGYGTIVANVQLNDGILDVDPGQTMNITGAVTGTGVVMGTVNAAGGLLVSPTAPLVLNSLDRGLAIGGRTATLYSNGPAIVNYITNAGGTLNTGSGGVTILSYSGNGTINGNVIATGTFSGHGTINGNLQLVNSLVSIDEGYTLGITGNYTGYGIQVGNANDGQGNMKSITSPTGQVNYQAPSGVTVGDQTAYVYSTANAYIRYITVVGGHIVAPNGLVTGELDGTGQVTTPLLEMAGRLGPGFTAGAIPGEISPLDDNGTTLTINGDLVMDSTSSLSLSIGGDDSDPSAEDHLVVDGSAMLGGTLMLTFTGGFVPAAGDQFSLIEADSISGAFSDVQSTGLPANLKATFNPLTDSIGVVNASAVPEPADSALAAVAVVALLGRRSWRNRIKSRE